MKKIFTLLFSFGAFASSFAQGQRDWDHNTAQNNPYAKTYPAQVYDRDRDHDGDHDRDNRGVYNNNYGYGQRDMQIASINRNFDFQIQRISRIESTTAINTIVKRI